MFTKVSPCRKEHLVGREVSEERSRSMVLIKVSWCSFILSSIYWLSYKSRSMSLITSDACINWIASLTPWMSCRACEALKKLVIDILEDSFFNGMWFPCKITYKCVAWYTVSSNPNSTKKSWRVTFQKLEIYWRSRCFGTFKRKLVWSIWTFAIKLVCSRMTSSLHAE